jgi:hypothetical protein
MLHQLRYPLLGGEAERLIADRLFRLCDASRSTTSPLVARGK